MRHATGGGLSQCRETTFREPTPLRWRIGARTAALPSPILRETEPPATMSGTPAQNRIHTATSTPTATKATVNSTSPS